MQRRDFLKAAFGAGAAVALGPAIAPAKLKVTKEICGGTPPGKHHPKFVWGDEYQQYLDELNKNWKKWEKVFGKFQHQYRNHPKEVAMLAENLRLWNERLSDLQPQALVQQWKRISMPICWRTQQYAKTRDLFGYQIMTQPTQLAFCSAINPDVKEIKDWGICGYQRRNCRNTPIYGTPIPARTRKLKTMISLEAMQDLKTVNGLDAEAELVAIFSMELALEQDREHLCNVRNNCPTLYNHYGNSWNQRWNDRKCDRRSGSQNLSSFLEWAIAEERQKFLDRGSEIHEHEPYEWIVTSPDIVAKLEQEDALTPDEPSYWSSSLGIHLAGWLRNATARVRVYKDPMYPVNEITLGRKYSDIDTGYIVMPYVHYLQTPSVLNPEDFFPRRGTLCRGTRILTNPNFYAKMIVHDETLRRQT